MLSAKAQIRLLDSPFLTAGLDIAVNILGVEIWDGGQRWEAHDHQNR